MTTISLPGGYSKARSASTSVKPTRRQTASISGFFDYWFVDFAVRRSDLIYYLSYPIRRIQTGIIQNYAALTIAGILLIVSYFFMR